MLRRLAREGLELEARDRRQTTRYRNVLDLNFSQDGILLGSTWKICRVCVLLVVRICLLWCYLLSVTCSCRHSLAGVQKVWMS
jgi:hypothetical protein